MRRRGPDLLELHACVAMLLLGRGLPVHTLLLVSGVIAAELAIETAPFTITYAAHPGLA